MDADVTLITGASSGLGRATALHLARKGHRVFASMRSPERDAGALLEIARAEGLALAVVALDVTVPGAAQRAVDDVLARAGRIDVLVNNAGVGVLTALERATELDVRTVFDTNVFGALWTMQAVLPSMRAAGRGTIVNVSSVAARAVGVAQGVYAASKLALEGMSEALALEVMQFGIRIAIVEPGFYETPMLDKLVGGLRMEDASPYANIERRVQAIYVGGRGAAQDPERVAEAVEHAIVTNEPRFRYLVGGDALVFARERARMADEEYLRAFGRPMSDEAFFTEFAARFPMPTTAD